MDPLVCHIPVRAHAGFEVLSRRNGFGLWRSKVVPAWAGLLMAVGALMFPIANIGFDHIPAVIHLTDVSLLIADGWIGWKILTQKSFWEQDAANAPQNA